MRRIASHYIYWRQFYRMHYVELDDSGILTGVFPLEGEIAGTEFYDGILILVPIPVLDARLKGNKRYYLNSYSDTPFVIPSQVRERVAFDMLPGEQLADALERRGFTGIIEAGSPVCVLLLGGIPLTTAKFGADDSRSDGYIQRL